jgi:exonuclease III
MQISMNSNNLKLKTISLNVRGLRTFENRKCIFNWLSKQNSDICFLQETYSTEEIENQWKKQWSGDVYFAHGSIHSRGVAILIRKSFDFKLKSIRSDEEGRYLILETTIQDVPFLLVNIYAPNTTTKQSLFFQKLSELIYGEGYKESDYKIILGGDLNVTMDPDLDCSG